MKASIVGKMAGLFIGLCGVVSAQPGAAVAETVQLAPKPVTDAAVAAVAELGKQVELGKYGFAIERMYPAWKERMAARLGGVAELEKQLAETSVAMVKSGVQITSFQPAGQPESYEVGMGKKVETVNGQSVESLIYTKWLVLVPTSTKFSVPRSKAAPEGLKVESIGFQVAICDKGKNDWTFIDGSGATLNELRKLFANLPQDMQLPPILKKDITGK